MRKKERGMDDSLEAIVERGVVPVPGVYGGVGGKGGPECEANHYQLP